MARYIKCSDALAICRKWNKACFEQNDSKGQWCAETIEDEILDLPAADVVEVKHGEWIEITDDVYYCSKCNRTIYFGGMGKDFFPYCHCGAKMDVSKMEIATSGGNVE